MGSTSPHGLDPHRLRWGHLRTVEPIVCICNNICVYEILFAKGVVNDLKKIRAYDRRRILDEMKEKLSHQPTRPTKHRKLLHKLVPPFEAVPPIWQLRVGDYRVFYDVDESAKKIFVRAIRRKPARLTTGDIL